MTLKRPYPESYRAVHHRAPRLATTCDGRTLLLSEPGFLRSDRAVLHSCGPISACEGLPEERIVLIAPEDGVFACPAGAEVVTGIWIDRTARVWLAWSDGSAIHARRSRDPLRQFAALADPQAWENLNIALPDAPDHHAWHLGSGLLAPQADDALWLAVLAQPSGAIVVLIAGPEAPRAAALHTHRQNHTPSLAIDPDGRQLRVVWDTEDLRILYRSIATAAIGRSAADAPPFEVWRECHHPDVASNGREVIVTYTGHMHAIKYGYFDGQQWQQDQHLTTLHPRFHETVEHSPWLWRDAAGRIHLSFACLTRRLIYDALWLSDGFADPQPIEGLFHPSSFNDDVRVPPERVTLERGTGSLLVSSTFLPEQHGMYAQPQPSIALSANDPLLFLDLAEISEARNLAAHLEPMRTDPAEPILTPTGSDHDFDGARVMNGGTVLHVDGRYRMWYSALPKKTNADQNWYDQVFVGYAESDDARTWRRTDTGLGLRFQDRPAPHLLTGLDHNACIFIDPVDDPQRRYKAIKFQTRAHRCDAARQDESARYLGLPRKGWLATSPDGLNWMREAASLDFPGPEPYGFTPQAAMYDPTEPNPARRYKAIGWMSLVGKRRGATLAYSADAQYWVVAERSPLLDPRAAVSPIRGAGPYSQIHDATMARYGRYLLAFYGHQTDGATEDIRLAVSRDGERFNFVAPEAPLVARGAPGTWNSGYMMPIDLLVGDATDDGQMVLFYGSSAGESERQSGIPSWRVCGGRAVARRDRFVALRPHVPGEPAALLTSPITLAERGQLRLAVNARLGESSQLRAALVDAGDPSFELPGYELSACVPMHGDRLDHVACWRGSSAISDATAPFRVRLVLIGTPTDAMFSLRFLHAE